jgi:hypothetical protein
MAEISRFQQMNGCSACVHASNKDPNGREAGSYGANFWCLKLDKAVHTKDGAACPEWKYQE